MEASMNNYKRKLDDQPSSEEGEELLNKPAIHPNHGNNDMLENIKSETVRHCPGPVVNDINDSLCTDENKSVQSEENLVCHEEDLLTNAHQEDEMLNISNHVDGISNISKDDDLLNSSYSGIDLLSISTAAEPADETLQEDKISGINLALSSNGDCENNDKISNTLCKNISSPIEFKEIKDKSDEVIIIENDESKGEIIEDSANGIEDTENENEAPKNPFSRKRKGEIVDTSTLDESKQLKLEVVHDSIVLDSPDELNKIEVTDQNNKHNENMEISDTESVNTTSNSTDADAGILDTSISELEDFPMKTTSRFTNNLKSTNRDSVVFVDEIKPADLISTKFLKQTDNYLQVNPVLGIVDCKTKELRELETGPPPVNHLVILSDSEGENTPDLTNAREKSMIDPKNEEIHDLTLSDIPNFEFVMRQDENNSLLSLVITRPDKKQIDYNADVSHSTHSGSPSSVTSGGMYTLPDKRYSSISSSTISTSTVSSRTTDGSFVIPFPPANKVITKKYSIKGYADLYKTFCDVFNNLLRSQGIIPDSDMLHKIPEEIGNENDNEGNNNSTPKSSRKQKKVAAVVKRADTPTILQNKYKTINSPEMTSNDNTKFNRDRSLEVYNENTDDNINKSLIKNTQVKNYIRNRTESPSTNLSKAMKTLEDDQVGTKVLARWWGDKKYYAGCIKEIKDANKYVIQFDDNRIRTLPSDVIIFGQNDELPLVGQSVYAIVENDDYEPGLVSSINKHLDGKIFYSVIFDRGITLPVEACDIRLSEDQAKALKDQNIPSTNDEVRPSTPRRKAYPNVDLDNIIVGSRNRKNGNSKPDTPKPGSSGLGKKKSSKPKTRHISENSDQSFTEPPSPVDTKDAVFIEEVQGVEPELQKTPKKIQGALTGPFRVKGRGRLSGRRSSKVVGNICDNTDPETVELLGPIPTATNFFKNIIFLLTCTEPPKKIVTDDIDVATDSEVPVSDCEEREFNSVPFVKERLRCQIEAAGGVVYSHFEDVPEKKYKFCKLIAPRPCHTAKYIQCLASNIPAKTHGWIIRCCKTKRLLKDCSEDLPAGWFIEKKCFIEYHSKLSNPFNNYLIILCSDNPSFIAFWGRVCKLAGASVRNIDDNVDLTSASAIVTDSDCPIKIKELAQNEDIPLVSTMWVVQSLISGQVCGYENHIKYHHNYTTDTD